MFITGGPSTNVCVKCVLFITAVPNTKLCVFITAVPITKLFAGAWGNDSVCAVCVCFITAGPITKLCAWGEEESGGHVL